MNWALDYLVKCAARIPAALMANVRQLERANQILAQRLKARHVAIADLPLRLRKYVGMQLGILPPSVRRGYGRGAQMPVAALLGHMWPKPEDVRPWVASRRAKFGAKFLQRKERNYQRQLRLARQAQKYRAQYGDNIVLTVPRRLVAPSFGGRKLVSGFTGRELAAGFDRHELEEIRMNTLFARAGRKPDRFSTHMSKRLMPLEGTATRGFSQPTQTFLRKMRTPELRELPKQYRAGTYLQGPLPKPPRPKHKVISEQTITLPGRKRVVRKMAGQP